MKQEVPEDIYKDPNDFYTLEEVKRYDNNSGMKKTQMILTKDCMDLFFEKKVINQNIEILDIGCGTGFSLEYLKESGFKKLIGIDPSIEMLNQCKKKGFLCYLGGFEDLSKIKEIKNKKFDLILSISALQWCISNKQEIEIKNIIKKFGKDLLEKLTENGIVIIQFYPTSENKFEIVKNAFLRSGFKVEEFIKNKGNLKKQKYFLILNK